MTRVLGATHIALTCLGALGAWTGGARIGPAVARTISLGSAAMAATFLAGSPVGGVVG